jgi:CheY-like chemotaxis protein
MRILVAEDEEDIRTVYHNALTEREHEVVITSNGEECLEVYLSRTPEHYDGEASQYFDVVILDYKMPKKDGLQVAKEILEINSEQRIIFASAYVMETLTESVKELRRVVELVQKPFSMSVLIDTVENKEAYEGLKILMRSSRDVIEDLDNPTIDQLNQVFEGLRKVQKFRGF